MTKHRKGWLTLILAFAAVIIVYFMPRDSQRHYNYEENRPWSYSLLTAPFDVTVYRDSATVRQMIDSVNRTMVPIYRRDASVPARVDNALSGADTLSVRLRQRLARTIGELYSRGVVDSPTAMAIARGELPEVKFQKENEYVTCGTGAFISQRDAYALIDSLYSHDEEHRALSAIELSQLLQPNVVEDKEATRLYHETLIQPIISGIGVIQKGERIIAQGDIVTPQLYQILKTYEQTLDKMSSNNRTRTNYMLAGQALFVVVILAALYFFTLFYYPRRLRDPRELLGIMLLVVGFFVFSVGMRHAFQSGMYIVPLAILPIVIAVFYDNRTAFFTYVMEVVLCSVMTTYMLEYVFVELVAGAAVLFSLKELSRRSELLRSAAIAFAAYVVAYVSVEMMTAGSLGSITWRLIGFFAVNALLISFAYIVIFVYEKIFGMVSVVTLVELSDINNPQLRELSQECPGTFQHSMAVSNLATEAARRIGANVQLVRAGALYHDIGKIDNPAFFTENQHGVNPHDALTPLQSAGIIIRHIADGLRRADKAKLPQTIKDLIVQHHGNGKAKYFYNTYCAQHPDEEVDPEPFTYPGPNPRTREASLLMMADTVEAASRSLTDYSPESIRNLVDRLIDAQVADGLHNDSPLSFRDIKEIKDCFCSRLRSMYHARISYPPEVKRPTRPAGAETAAPSDDKDDK